MPKPSGQASEGHGHTRGRFQKGGAGGPGRPPGGRSVWNSPAKRPNRQGLAGLGGVAQFLLLAGLGMREARTE